MYKKLVAQHNDLIDAHYSLSLVQAKLFAFLASRVVKDDEGFYAYDGPASELYKECGIANKYDQLKRNLRTMHTTLFSLRSSNYEDEFVMFHRAKYSDRENIRIQFHEDLEPLLLNLKNNFTQVELVFILRLKSSSANRLYFLLKRWAGLGEYTTKIEDLKNILFGGIEHKAYHLYGNFKNRVLLPALNDINTMTDLSVAFIEKKKGRAVASIVFDIQKKPPAAPPHKKTAALIEADHRSKKEDKIYTKHLKEFLKLPKAEQGDWIEAGKSSLFYIPGAELEHAVHLFVESKNKVADVVQ